MVDGYGLLNHPTHIAAARELAIEGAEFRKLQAPLCLTHHPKSPLTAEEVLERAAPPVIEASLKSL